MPQRHPVARRSAPSRARPAPPRAGRRLAAVIALATAASASYTVQPGDTLSGIALRHRVGTSALAQANDLADPNRIVAGRTLQIPGTDGATGGGGAHTVAPGETLSGIAARYGTSTASLVAANGLADPDRVIAGRTLQVPGGGAASSAAAAPAASAGTAAPSGTASRADVGALIEQVARAHGWNPAFVKALAWQESGWSNRVVSSAGARGIMQVMPDTGRFVSQQLAGRTLDLDDPADNVLAGVLFLDHLHALTGGDTEQILAGYFQGLASVRANGVYPSTAQYTANVLALRDRF